MTIKARFEIDFRGSLDADGNVIGDLPPFATDRDTLVELYRWMTLTRILDKKAITLQRTGRLGTYASSLGQEAVSVGTAHAMLPSDVLLPSFREHGAQLLRGVTAEEIFLFWGGDERGSDFAGPRLDFPVSIPVSSHTAHAAGVALAFRLRGESRAAVAMLGDGATSKGDFYEAMNIAGVWELPAVFVVTNNQWAISVRRSRQTASETLAQKAIAAGIACVQVDGNDVIAVRSTVADALARARGGGGAYVVEAITYRLNDHTTVDDASRYRNDDEVAAAWKLEPLLRLRNHLVATHGWTKADETALMTECNATIDAAAEAYLSREAQPPESIFDYTFATLPEAVVRQRAELLREIGHE